MKISKAEFARYEKALDAGARAVNCHEMATKAGISRAAAVFIFCNYEGFKYGRLKLGRAWTPAQSEAPDSCGYDPTVEEAK